MKRIHELVGRIKADGAHADQTLAAFVRDNTFPLIDGDTAIFFFWDGHRAEAVHLVHWVFGLESRQALFRIEGTEAFFLPVELPGSARVEYKFEVVRDGWSRWVRDPHNARQAFDPFGSNSVCPMAGYSEPHWVHPEPNVRPGSLESFELQSEVWGDTREISVYLPVEYKPFKRYPLLICHDGRDYLKFANLQVILDNLIHRHEVRPLIVAFTSGSRERNREYGANPKQASFLVEEVLPAMVERYGISEDPHERGLMGASFGAVSSLYTAWHHPGVFRRLLLQSGSFVFTDVGGHGRGPLFDPVVAFVNQFRADPGRIGARVFMSCGTFESLISFNRSLHPMIRDAGLQVRFVESQDGHNWINWRDRVRDGLTWLFPGHLWMYYD